MKVQARLPRVLFLRVNCSKQPFLHRQVVRDLSPSSRESSLTRLTWAICKRRTRCKGAMLAAATPLRETIAYSLKQLRAMIAALTGCRGTFVIVLVAVQEHVCPPGVVKVVVSHLYT
jgi:hypothetical protein